MARIIKENAYLKVRVDPTVAESCLHVSGASSRQQPTVAISDHANRSERHWREPPEMGVVCRSIAIFEVKRISRVGVSRETASSTR